MRRSEIAKARAEADALWAKINHPTCWAVGEFVLSLSDKMQLRLHLGGAKAPVTAAELRKVADFCDTIEAWLRDEAEDLPPNTPIAGESQGA